jgi:Family of unknown function (DUF5958)
MKIDEQILLNQLAQGLIDLSEGERWFRTLGEGEKRAVLQDLNFMIANSSPHAEDVAEAIRGSGLKPTYTPCVLLKTGDLRLQLAKLANLPENELAKAFRLLLTLFGVSDGRRRREKPIDTENHWWHRDLNDPMVIAKIKQEFGSHAGISRTPGFRPRRVN